MKMVFAIGVSFCCAFAAFDAGDSAAVRAILDENDLTSVAVSSVAKCNTEGRIDTLELIGETGGGAATMGGQSVTIIPAEIGELTELVRLRILRNPALATIPPEVGLCTKILKLELEYNAIESLPDEIGDLAQLTHLRVHQNLLAALPDSIGKCESLVSIMAYGNRLTNLPSSIVNLSALTTLNITENTICEITDPDVVAWLDENFPDWVNKQFCLTNDQQAALEAILAANGLDDIALQDVAKTLGGMVTELSIQKTPALTVIPAEIGELTALKMLVLNENGLTSIADEIAQCTSLRQLSVKKNMLVDLPAGLIGIDTLTKVYADSNSICAPSAELAEWLDSVAGEWRFHQVCALFPADSIAVQKIIDESGIPLVTAPQVVTTDLDRVVAINLGESSVSQLVVPPEAADLERCEEITLWENTLTSIPPEISLFPALRVLRLSGNEIASLPAELGQVTTLEDLFIPGNKLTTLPAELMDLPNLTSVNVRENMLCNLDEEMEAWLTGLDAEWAESQTCTPVIPRAAVSAGGFSFSARQGVQRIYFDYAVASRCRAALRVFNAEGRLVEVLHDGFANAGNHTVSWHTARVPAGIYYVKFQAGSFKTIQKMITVE